MSISPGMSLATFNLWVVEPTIRTGRRAPVLGRGAPVSVGCAGVFRRRPACGRFWARGRGQPPCGGLMRPLALVFLVWISLLTGVLRSWAETSTNLNPAGQAQ